MSDHMTISLHAALRRQMVGVDNDMHLPLEGDDPLLRMSFHEPTFASTANAKKTRKAEAEQKPLANKKPRLSRSSSAGSAPPQSSQQQQQRQKNVVLKSPLLHQSCRLFAQNYPVIESALEMEPQATCKRAESARKGNPNNSSYIVGDAKVPYSLPINILLHQNASVDVIKLMAEASPKALAMKDGRDECCALIIALRLCGRSTQTAAEEEECVPGMGPVTVPEEVLSANPAAAQLHDRRRNFPLHIAAYVGASFSVINKLYYAYPEALLETNFCGETPMDICIRNGKCSEMSSNFLQEKMDHLKLARLRNMASQRSSNTR